MHAIVVIVISSAAKIGTFDEIDDERSERKL